MELKKGMKVKFKKKEQLPHDFDNDGNIMILKNFFIVRQMFEFLGETVTISEENIIFDEHKTIYFRINEDYEEWLWHESCIDIDYMKKEGLKKFLEV